MGYTAEEKNGNETGVQGYNLDSSIQLHKLIYNLHMTLECGNAHMHVTITPEKGPCRYKKLMLCIVNYSTTELNLFLSQEIKL